MTNNNTAANEKRPLNSAKRESRPQVPSAQRPHVIIVGASISGAVLALYLANRGWHACIIEKRQSLDHYKKICTHIIHPSGVKQLKQLGVFEELKNTSTQMTAMRVRYGEKSVLFPFGGKPAAANIERRDIDPALKNKLTQHPNIHLLTGHSLSSLIFRGKRVAGIETRCKGQPGLTLRAPLLIGADGRDSMVAELAGAERVSYPNERIALYSYFKCEMPPKESRVWAMQHGAEYVGCLPNSQRILVSWYISRAAYQAMQGSSEELFETPLTFLRRQGIQVGTRLEPIAVAKDTAPREFRSKQLGMALVGDAKLAADPLTGVGCSWAMDSALMLSKCLGSAPEDRSLTALNHIRIDIRLRMYDFLHALRFRLPSWLMSLVSAHGRVVFNAPVYRCLAWITRERPQR